MKHSKIKTMGRMVAAWAALLTLAAPAIGHAASWSVLGGRTLDPRDSALRVSAGWPDVHVAYHLPISRDIELAPKLGLFYGQPALGRGFGSTIVGNSLGGELRWRVFEEGDFSLAVKGEAGLLLYYKYANDFRAGMRLSPGLAADYVLTSKVNLTMSFDIPIDFVFGSPVFALIPILFGAGLEFEAKDNLLFFVAFKMGPAISAVSGFTDTGFGFDGRVGMAYKF